jgi:O-antigen/teichoic acid export membrane protein
LENSINNKRIIKNTILLYFRLIFAMGVSLYTSRVVLNTLGIEDYGIYNLVGGVVIVLGFFESCNVSSNSKVYNF